MDKERALREGIERIRQSKGIEATYENNKVIVTNLWNDKNVELIFENNDPHVDLYIDILNNVIFPPSLRAIYHEDLQSMEFIYRIGQLKNEPNGDFRFAYDGSVFTCGFRKGSDRLALLALFARTTTTTSTENKNLDVLRAGILEVIRKYTRGNVRKIEEVIGESEFIEYLANNTLSFWIDGLDISDDNMHYKLNLINYYMEYFNRDTPYIVIDQDEGHETFDIPQYPKEVFPEEINAIDIDPDALDIYITARTIDPYKKYIQLYQVLEYYAYYYANETLRNTIKSRIVRPDLYHEIDVVVNEIIDDAIRAANNNDIKSKIKKLIGKIDLSRTLGHLSHIQEFREDKTLPTNIEVKAIYRTNEYDIQSITNNIVTLRNSMVHSKERRNEGRLQHTRRNMEYVRLWAEVLQSIVMDIMVHVRRSL